MIKKDVTYGDWRIVRHDDSKMEVYKNGELCPKSAPALREIAEEVGLEVNPDWRTSQLGSNVINAVEAALANQNEPETNEECDEITFEQLKKAVVYFSFTSEEGPEYAYAYLICNRKLYWVDENWDVPEPVDEEVFDAYNCYNNPDYVDELDSYSDFDEFLEKLGEKKLDSMEVEVGQYPEFASEDGKYTLSVYVGDKMVYEKVIVHYFD
ncbi:MAG: hypothetical protein U0L47_04430 [Paludibacteraceae bacterium]|nr:hypothetical protein [Paludibacteraceae bacterium]